MQLVGIDSDNGSIFFVKIANVEDVLTVQRIHFEVVFIPGICELLAIWSEITANSYQKVNAASLGPGKLEMGLR